MNRNDIEQMPDHLDNPLEVESDGPPAAELNDNDVDSSIENSAEEIASNNPSANPLIVSLERFEGPLDLLLFFIKRDEIDIYDIPIARITEEFLMYTRAIQMLSLEQAGEFIVMAAELMRIKANMLLPREERPAREDEEEDPRSELVRRLLEYKQYKEVAEQLRDREDEYRNLHYRQYFKGDQKVLEEPTAEEMLANVTLFRLLEAYKRAIDRAPKGRRELVIEQINWTIEEQAEFIISEVMDRSQMTMTDLFESRSRMWITVTFLALLELIKSGRVRFHEEEGDVILYEA